MVKASLKLTNGTVVTIEGTPEEVKHLLEVYSDEGKPTPPETQSRGSNKPKASATKRESAEGKGDGKPDLNAIVTLVKDCDEAEAMESQILDRRSLVDRTLLALYIVHEYLSNAFLLTSGDVSKITTDLGIPISQSNASTTLSGTASKYVIGDKVKVRGKAVRYKLSRRGVKYMKEVLAGNADG